MLMNKHALYATVAMLPVLAYAPLSNAAPEPKDGVRNAMKLDKPLELGEKMIDFQIDDASGGIITLSELLKDGPVVLTFYRGSWCPYCVTELSSIQKRLKKISKAGAQVLAIAPETPSETADLTEQKKLGFLFGTDQDNELATRLGLSFKLDGKTIKRYRQYGIDVPESNGTKSWELPVPATYVIDTDRTIRLAYVDEDYTKRADYDQVIDVLKDIQKEAAQSADQEG